MPYEELKPFSEGAALRRLPDYELGMTVPVIERLRRSGKLEAAHVCAAGRHYRLIELANGQHPETGEGEHMRGNTPKTSYDGAAVALVDARGEVARVLSAMGARLYATLEAILVNGMSARALAEKRGEAKDVTVGRIVAAMDSLVDFQQHGKIRIP